MKTTPVTPSDLTRSVLSVPPLCRDADMRLDQAENARIVAHLRSGGVTTHLWGGNANLYNMGLSEFTAFLDMAEAIAEGDEWVIPSIGPDFGKAMDQAEILSRRSFPTAMILPMRFPATPAGVARGIGLVAEKMGRGLIAYVKDDGYIDPADLGALVRDGSVLVVKYGTVKRDPADDPALAAIVKHVDPALVVSGQGERPIVAHARHFGLGAFTSGSVCVAPRLSTLALAALRAKDFAEIDRLWAKFRPLEDLRDGISPLRVLHEALPLAGIAETGPMLPMLSNITDPARLAEIGRAAKALLADNARASVSAAA
jgi:dihydrodipicolinate synthase/N-acetylneuraminate lyase